MAASELKTRIISATMVGAVVLALTWLSPISFMLLCGVGAGILWREWLGLTRTRGTGWMILGIVYIGTATASLIYLRYENLNILLAVFAIVWTGDIAAYLVGKKFGKHKIAPAISPGKSWEGLGGSIIASAFVAAALGNVAPIPHAILGAFFAVLGLGGDLFESSMKRRAGVKDSGTLLPGHGGLFDRVDALLPCAIFAAIVLYTRLHLQ
jgi:phosphatidate cytidylyltransferase